MTKPIQEDDHLCTGDSAAFHICTCLYFCCVRGLRNVKMRFRCTLNHNKNRKVSLCIEDNSLQLTLALQFNLSFSTLHGFLSNSGQSAFPWWAPRCKSVTQGQPAMVTNFVLAALKCQSASCCYTGEDVVVMRTLQICIAAPLVACHWYHQSMTSWM